MKKIFFLIVTILAGSICAKAQSTGPSVINTAGGSATISGFTFEYSIGQLISSTDQLNGSTFSNGVLQPVFSVTNKVIHQQLIGKLHVFPNPASNMIYVQPDLTPNTSCSITLTDVQGKTLEQSTTLLPSGKERQSVDVSKYAAGVYFLLIRDSEGKEASFTIQKQ